MTTYDKIVDPVKQPLIEFNNYYNDAFHVNDKNISQIIEISVVRSGKQMRPLLVLLSAAISGGISHSSIVGATLIEMIHTASLIHDDVVDEAFYRRNDLSVNALFRGRKSVLIGDFVLARAINMITNENELAMLKTISRSLEMLCEGELLQINQVDKLDTNEEMYFDIITKKTAVLLGASAEIGSRSAGANDDTINTMRHFGELLGIAFQIKDDILDYDKSGDSGKNICNDLMEQKITLPLIYTLENADKKQWRKMMNLLSTVRKNPDNVYLLSQMVEHAGGLDFAEHRMNQVIDQALTLLDIFEDSPYKQSLIGYAKYVLNRTK